MRKMVDQPTIRVVVCLLIATFITSHLLVSVTARYLPTRSQDDRLDKLRELLKDLLEGDMERKPSVIDYSDLVNGGRSGIFKRSTGNPSLEKSIYPGRVQGIDDFRSAGGFPSFLRRNPSDKSME